MKGGSSVTREHGTLDPRLLAVLACPQDKGPLYYLGDDTGLYNPRLRRQYDVRDGIPVMLIDEAHSLDDAAHEALMARIADEDVQPTFVAAENGAGS
jgi:uncharacterized protein YbaR (Trm112 family)